MCLLEKVIVSIYNHTGTDIHLSKSSLSQGKFDVPVPEKILRRKVDCFSVHKAINDEIDFRFLIHIGEIRRGAIQRYHHADVHINSMTDIEFDKITDGFFDNYDIGVTSVSDSGATNHILTVYNKKI